MKPDIEKLLDKYYEGDTTLQEEKLLRQFFQEESIPAHLQSHADQFRYFANVRNQHPSFAFTSKLAAQLMATEPGRGFSFTTWFRRLAASVSLIILGFAGGIIYNHWRAASPESVSSREETPSALAMKQVLTFEHLPKTSASERIQAVNQSYELKQIDQDITQLLINTLNFDANVNVRLAACQALSHFANEPGVREALIQSLKIQTDPNLQISLIDTLVAIKEKRAVDEMQRLAQNQQVLDAVRQKAEEGINHLVQGQDSPS
ncbi:MULTISPECIES: HEAT repeat domain-containing protein [unclassified Spirosoma]|uniref:HEAT repeat domain-containing protein n=1 Tax=unclassified Spirosoma TaxID=2621999 RepID=UPI0009658B16|nr:MULTISPECIES: HEAT repeat domain-containing protein [unclassified Spirosoma]MBN8826503.1 HEAT repeat domain-containing protein [Spirosoma sp.]OJW76406.1 MAG: anti-sigma factor [Spirosoma sp. 48-14]